MLGGRASRPVAGALCLLCASCCAALACSPNGLPRRAQGRLEPPAGITNTAGARASTVQQASVILGYAQPIEKHIHAHNSDLHPQGSCTESRPVLPSNAGRFRHAGKLDEIISPKSAEPMQALQQVNLIAGKASRATATTTRCRRYLLRVIHRRTGQEPHDGVRDAVEQMARAEPFEAGMGALRRNLVVRGLSGDELNDMVGHRVRVGATRLFVHRRTVPQVPRGPVQRPGLMNRLWDICGSRILKAACVRRQGSGDPGTHQPARQPGAQAAGLLRATRPTHQEHASMIVPPAVAFGMSSSTGGIRSRVRPSWACADTPGLARDGSPSCARRSWSPLVRRSSRSR